MAIVGGYRTHDEGTIHRYRVPDLLTLKEFQMYMAYIYGKWVDFRDLTDDEKAKLESGDQLVFTSPEPSDRDREIAKLRDMLGINDLETRLKVNRKADPDNRDPIVELDSRVLSDEEFEKKYGVKKEIKPPEPPEQRSSEPEVSTVKSSSSTTKK